MATFSLSCVVGSVHPGLELQVAKGDSLAINLRLQTIQGTTYDARGAVIYFAWEQDREPSGPPRMLALPGNLQGNATFVVSAKDCWYFTLAQFWWDAWIVLADGTKIQLVPRRRIVALQAVGPITVDDAPSGLEPVPLPLQQTVEIAGVLDLPGNTAPLPAPAPVRWYYAGEFVVRLALAQLQTTTGYPDSGAVGTLYVGRNGSPIGAPIPMVQGTAEEGTEGIFIARIDAAHQALVSEGDTITYQAWVRPTDQAEYAAHEQGEVALIPSGKPINQPPTIVLAAIPAQVVPGALALSIAASDPDGTLTADSFALLVNGTPTPATFALTNGSSWTTSVTLATLGAMSLSVVVTDSLGSSVTATRSTVVVTPAVEITADTPQDVGAVTTLVTVTPAPPNGTAVTILEGTTTRGSGVLTNGAAAVATSALGVGTHALTARIMTLAGAVVSPAVNVDVVAVAPVVDITTPSGTVTIGQSYAITASVTIATGGTIASVQYRVGGTGNWASMTHGSGSTWTASWTPAEPGEITVEVRATDGGSPATTTTSSETVTAEYLTLAWGPLTFAGASMYAETDAPSTAAPLTVHFALDDAIDGCTILMRVPVGPTDLLLDVPEGWKVWQNARIVSPIDTEFPAALPWVPGCACDFLLQIDSAAHRIHWSSKRYTPAIEGYITRHWPLHDDGAAYTAAGNPVLADDAVRAGGGPLLSGDFGPDPNATIGGVSVDTEERGNVFLRPAWARLPCTSTTTKYSISWRMRAPCMRTITGDSGATSFLATTNGGDCVFGFLGGSPFDEDGNKHLAFANVFEGNPAFPHIRRKVAYPTYYDTRDGYSLGSLIGVTSLNGTEYDGWATFAIVADGTIGKIYVNGMLRATGTIIAHSLAQGFYLGVANGDFGDVPAGGAQYCDIVYYDGVWTDAQVAAICTQTRSIAKAARHPSSNILVEGVHGSSQANSGNAQEVRVNHPTWTVTDVRIITGIDDSPEKLAMTLSICAAKDLVVPIRVDCGMVWNQSGGTPEGNADRLFNECVRMIQRNGCIPLAGTFSGHNDPAASGPYTATRIRAQADINLNKYALCISRYDLLEAEVSLPDGTGTAGPLGVSSTYYNEAPIPGGSVEAGPHMGPRQPRTFASDPGGQYQWPNGTPENPCAGVTLWELIFEQSCKHWMINTGIGGSNTSWYPPPLD